MSEVIPSGGRRPKSRDLPRMWGNAVDGFTKRYQIDKLIYYEVYDDPISAIAREKQLKRWSRKKKIILIKSLNPTFKDFSEEL